MVLVVAAVRQRLYRCSACEVAPDLSALEREPLAMSRFSKDMLPLDDKVAAAGREPGTDEEVA